MKQTLLLSRVEQAAISAAFAEVERARTLLTAASNETEAIATDIIVAHGAPPVAKGGSLTTKIIDGRAALVYDAAMKKSEEAEAPAPAEAVSNA